MLGFRWLATEAGAPDDSRYLTAVDRLADIDRKMLQEFPKVNAAFAAPSPDLQNYVDSWLGRRDLRYVVVMVHGFDYDVSAFNRDTGQPVDPRNDPYNLVFALPGKELAPVKPQSWLPIVGETDDGGNLLADRAIAFGWDSDYSFFGAHACLENGYQYAALDVAPLAGRALATLIATLRDKGMAVHVLSHSMGTRVTCQALRQLADAGITDIVHRVVLLEGAEYSIDAYDAVRRHPDTEFYNIGNQDDDWPPRGGFDSHPFRYNGTVARWVIAYDGIANLPNLVDLQIDRKVVQTWAKKQGYDLSSSPITVNGHTRGEHWAGYIHVENRRFLRDLLTLAGRTVAWLRDTDAPLGFARHNYGALDGVSVPIMPPTCDERRSMIRNT